MSNFQNIDAGSWGDPNFYKRRTKYFYKYGVILSAVIFITMTIFPMQEHTWIYSCAYLGSYVILAAYAHSALRRDFGDFYGMSRKLAFLGILFLAIFFGAAIPMMMLFFGALFVILMFSPAGWPIYRIIVLLNIFSRR